MGVGTHANHLSGWIRNYHLWRRDPTASRAVHGVLCCINANPVGSAESDRCNRLAYGRPTPGKAGPPRRRTSRRCTMTPPRTLLSAPRGIWELYRRSSRNALLANLGSIKQSRTVGRRSCTWLGWFGRSCSTSPFDHQESALVHRLPAGVWVRDDDGNDGDDRSNLCAPVYTGKKSSRSIDT